MENPEILETKKEWNYNPITNSEFIMNIEELFAISFQPLVPETAIMTKCNKYFILNGDHREQYEQLIDDGLEACMEYYKFNKPQFGSVWSNEE